MIPELGHFALIIALSLAVMQSIVPLIGSYLAKPELIAVAVPAARGQLLFLIVAFVALAYAFATKDFSVLYVATNSNASLPLAYRLSAVWGAHEGSLLLWAMILAGWTTAVSFFGRALPVEFRARVIAVMGLISIGFLLFMLLTSNPFARLLPAAGDGRDLNPLLQDFGLIIHPPMLYMGYVGMAVPFSFAVAALLEGKLDAAWTRWTRPWTTVAWIFLTVGITLGSWWAYYELGWGGWWFWDPVENASFMPWLVATALIHSLAVSEQRNAFQAWTILLAIFGFSLSLLGTFLVRSGVLVSVHAFATDPARGVFILAFLGIVIGGALALYASRAARMSGAGNFELLSRETLLLTNNVLLTVVCASVLLGTLYPLILDAFELGKVSVGPPYFDRVFVPLMLPLAILIGVGPLTRWKSDALRTLTQRLLLTLGVSLILGVTLVLAATSQPRIMVVAAISVAVWVIGATVQGIVERLRSMPTRAEGSRRLPRSFIGMSFAHFGVGVFIIGVTATSAYTVEKDLRMRPGDTHGLAGLEIEFRGVSAVEGPNFEAQRGTFIVRSDGVAIATLQPEKRVYGSQPQPMTEAAIHPGVSRDIYVAMGESLGDGAWTVRLYHKPFQRWVWLGPLMMALGGLLAASDRRYRRTVEKPSDAPGRALSAISASPASR